MSSDLSSKIVHVAVAAIVDEQRRVLIARRHIDSHQGGLWEFPGGKVEEGESLPAALQRECQEELDIHIDPTLAFPLRKIFHDYGDKAVLLDVWRVGGYRGTPRGREGQPIDWCPITELQTRDFPAANNPIVNCLQLPERLAITPELNDPEQLFPLLEAYQAQGLELVQLRQKQLAAEDYCHWFELAAAHSSDMGISLLFNHDRASFPSTLAAGRHFSAALAGGLKERPVPESQLFSLACHNLAELQRAEQLEADFALLSPVSETVKYPAGKSLGWQQFNELRIQVSLPVYALGGMSNSDWPAARQFGADGIAGISLFLG